jgi:GMP synthase (glutamine-hydrolysing)
VRSERKVLILDAAVHRDIYQPLRHWAAHIQGSVECFEVSQGGFPQSIDGCTHAILTGSEASINGDQPWILAECEVVRALAERGIPILGSCFGHQLAVRAISGKRFVRPSPTPEFGWLEVRPSREAAEDPVFRVLPDPWLVFSSHFDEVHSLPEDWAVLASSRECPCAAVRWRKGPVWGIQHHPEIDVTDGEILLAALQEMMLDKADLVRSRIQAEHRDSQVTAALVRAFLAQ